ncbi:MAG: long-chain fatty acid--CoA ligase [Aeropyrum sp.]|nr:long-chain fatty acid--CoA ligase [Aeropyrum sp.]MCE4616520.1 long-chain fatty acid--CoA ligase [Aeropyrum sp.]
MGVEEPRESSPSEIYLSKPWLKNYDEGVPHDIEIPNKPLYWILEESASKFPNRSALVFYGREVSYMELLDKARRFATYLKSIGVDKGDVVGIFLPNSPQFAIAFYGALMVGATVSPMNVLYSPREIHHQLSDNKAKVLVAIDLFKDKIVAGLPDSVEKVLWTGIQDFLPPLKSFLYKIFKKPPKPPSGGVHGRFMDALKSEPISQGVEVDIENDIAALMYTGGTTGTPKGAMLTHKNLLANVLQIDAWFKRGVKGKDVFIGVLPWFHIYGLTAVLNSGVHKAATIIVYARPDIDEIMKDIQKYKATVFHGVPTLYRMIINHPKVSKFDLTSLEVCISGAEPLPKAVAERFMELTGAKLREGYGLTETSPVTHVNPIEGEARYGSIGVPVPSTLAAIADPEEDRILPQGEVGELIVSGPQVMRGYYNRPEENEKVFMECCGMRWLRTGDMAKMDEDGYFYIVDRKKDIIKYKGYSVFPREIEEVLYRHKCVREAAVIGVPHPEYNEYPKAFISLREECKGKITPEELIEFARENLAPYKVPKEVEIRDDLPKSGVGKILRRVLREEELKKRVQEPS